MPCAMHTRRQRRVTEKLFNFPQATMRMVSLLWMSSIVFTVFGSGIVCGQDYPSKPLHVMTSGAGGASDFMARIIASEIPAFLGQQAIVDNRAGIMLEGRASPESLFSTDNAR